MAIKLADLKWRGSAVMAEDNVTANIGGAIDLTIKVTFVDNTGGLFQIVSSAGGDTTPTVTFTGLDIDGDVISDTKTLNGQTPVTSAKVFDVILKAVKSGTTTGDIAVEAQTATLTGTAQSGSATGIILATDASSSDDTYNGYVIRITSGTGSGQIREIIEYIGSSKSAYVSYAWGTQPDSTSVYRISRGLVFDRSPDEIMIVRRPFYNINSLQTGGGTRDYYEKIFAKNAHGSSALFNAVVKELTTVGGRLTFGVAASVNDTGTASNRITAPAAITFNTSNKAVPGTDLAAGSRIGVWLKLSLVEATPSSKDTISMSLAGETV